ncbi:MAG: pirin family protein [Prevotellaceae bacterium]|jgi:redox-sensitive bicupin YhaK (pirin superfamily)|nr:pirin family protein [Prevotellaceae bacterium]
MATRKVLKTVTGTRQIDGAGVRLVRVIGYHDVRDFDPFLMLDAFDSRNPNDYIKGFPYHPHRGIETFTYLIKGQMEHGDSLGNRGSIGDGEAQWMTAGSGIMHQEMPQASEHLLGFQLWINLPQKDKMIQPCYFDVKRDMIKTVAEENATVKIVAGDYKNQSGVKGKHVEIQLLDIQVQPCKNMEMLTDKNCNLFVYIIEGSGFFGDDSTREIPRSTAVLFDSAENFRVVAGKEGIRFALFAGKPLKEPVAWGGPIVMNTREELDRAFVELDEGTFIKHQ